MTATDFLITLRAGIATGMLRGDVSQLLPALEEWLVDEYAPESREPTEGTRDDAETAAATTDRPATIGDFYAWFGARNLTFDVAWGSHRNPGQKDAIRVIDVRVNSKPDAFPIVDLHLRVHPEDVDAEVARVVDALTVLFGGAS